MSKMRYVCRALCKITNGNMITRDDPTIGVGLGRAEGEHATLEFFHSRGLINDEALRFHKVNGVPKEFYHDDAKS